MDESEIQLIAEGSQSESRDQSTVDPVFKSKYKDYCVNAALNPS